MHGAGGEWRVEEQRLSWEILDDFARRGGSSAASRRSPISTAATTKARHVFRGQSADGRALERDQGFLRPAMQRPNLTVLTDAWCNALRFDARERQRARAGIEFRRGDEESSFAEATRRDDPRLRRDQLASADCCSSPASARPRSCRHTASCRARPARRRREPAGSSATAHGVQGEERAHAERAGPTVWFGKAQMALDTRCSAPAR